MVSWRDLGGPARAIGAAVGWAVQAAQARDRMAFESAVSELAVQPVEATGLVLGALVRTLLEEQHTDGLDGDHVRAVLTSCYAEAITWLSTEWVRVGALLAVLSSALGIHEPGITYNEITGPVTQLEWADPKLADPKLSGDRPVQQRAPTAAEYAWHAPLLIADLLTAAGRPLSGYLDRAFAEIAVAETMEMP